MRRVAGRRFVPERVQRGTIQAATAKIVSTAGTGTDCGAYARFHRARRRSDPLARSPRTHASLALAADVETKVRSDRLGHSRTTITADLYAPRHPAGRA
jgi:hypothetical protein